MINGDKELLQQAIGNLITNAQIHNPDDCMISVCVEKRDHVNMQIPRKRHFPKVFLSKSA